MEWEVNMKKTVTSALCLVLVLSLFFSVSANALSGRTVTVSLDGEVIYRERPLLIGGVTYVPFRDFMQRNGCSVDWDDKTKTAYARKSSLEVSAAKDESYIVANGRYLYLSKSILEKGRMYVPLRTLIKALGGSVSWSQSEKRAYARSGETPIASGDSYYNQTDLYWLSRIINAESGNQPLLGKIAVGNVVMNRVRSELCPDSIYDVIFDNRYGVQFTPTSNGTIYNEPNIESVIAAKICLDGFSLNRDILYFINPDLATNRWVVDNCVYVFSVGEHDFYC